MVYFGKKQSGGTGPLPTNTATTDGNNTFTGNNTFNNPVVVPQPTNNNQAANKEYVDNQIATCAKLASSNTFTQANTFNGVSNFRAKVEMKNSTNNNGAFLENFDYQSKNYTSLKFFKNTTTNVLQIEANNSDNVVKINTANAGNILSINGLANPTGDNEAANKFYVDEKVKNYYWTGSVANGNTQNLATIAWTKPIIGVAMFRKRSDNKWFIIGGNQPQQLFRDDGTGQFQLYGADSSGSPSFTNEYKVYITYINI